MTISTVVNHTPWIPERVECLKTILPKCRQPIWVNDADYRGTDWQTSKVKWALDQWRWSVAQDTTHHLFLTDDLYLCPQFHLCLAELAAHVGDKHPIGLLSNHPEAPRLVQNGHRWYRTNSWLVGPAYVLPHQFLVDFLAWFQAKPDGNAPGCKGYANDDSSINEFVTLSGLYTCHPIPTIVEHRHDIGSTVGHGDRYSRERVSWRFVRDVVNTADGFEWLSRPLESYSPWLSGMGPHTSPLLRVGE